VRRLRLVFLGFAVLLLAPLLLLLLRAMGGVEREREDRHELVALRVFDEAERSLGDFLREEQQRPVDHYQERTESGDPSPLSAAPAREFVIAYFELLPDGTLQTPRAEQRAFLLQQLGLSLPLILQASGTRREAFGASLASTLPPSLEKKAKAGRPAPSPGTTRMLQRIAPITGKQESSPRTLEEPAVTEAGAAPPGDGSLSSYGVLERLNLASKSREADAAAKVSVSLTAEPDPQAAAAAPPASGALPRRSRAPLADEPLRERLSSPAEAGAEAADRVEPAPAAVQDERRRDAEPRYSSDRAPASALPAPLLGLVVPGNLLVLHRTVSYGVQQCVLIDLGRLASWLEASVLGASGLRSYLDLAFENLAAGAPLPVSASLPANRFVYDHRFGEPFSALRAQLGVAPLPDEGGSAYVYALAALLGVASTLGLWAVYRRVAVAVHFSERRSNFAAAVSHELKTPLTAIRMYAEMLRDGMVADDATRRAYLETITSESERLSRLINNVLEFSRLERRAGSLTLVSESLPPLLRAAVRTLEPHARAQGFVLTERLDDGLPPVQLDRDAIHQILFNLVDNALKYARGAERKEIEILCAADPEGVRLRVRDFGPGIPAGAQAHLFEAFYRAGDELTRQTQGTGIGLALVRELVQQMGGKVSARNDPDGGFAVQIVLRRS
jgi:signal transduction histidine kinase